MTMLLVEEMIGYRFFDRFIILSSSHVCVCENVDDIQSAGSVVPVGSVGDPVLKPPPCTHLPGKGGEG